MSLPAATPGSARSDDAVDLLWTAGWDSTYRLLELVVRRGRRVVPHYIVDPERSGTTQELKAMRAIRHRIARDFAGCERLVEPTRITLLDSIRPEPEISEKLARLRAGAHLGSQYDWLARYVRDRGIAGLELCIHADDRAEVFVREFVERVRLDDGDACWQLRPGSADADVGLFAAFRFPILELTKTEMRRNAEAFGFGPIMSLTWFCHRPINGMPCGLCNPCRYAIAEGMGDRLPLRARLRHRFSAEISLARKAKRGLRSALRGAAKAMVRLRGEATSRRARLRAGDVTIAPNSAPPEA